MLKGEKALLLSLPPCFRFKALKRKAPVLHPGKALLNTTDRLFHKNSPAGWFLKKNPHLLSYSFRVCDPHKGRGGFGFSSAAFNFLYALNQQHKTKTFKVSLSFLRKLWQEYRSQPFEGEFPPSGADLTSQWFKGLCVFSYSPFYIRALSWPFPCLNLAVLKTGISFPTWRHLKQLKSLKAKAFVDLKTTGQCAVQAVLKKNQPAFVEAVQKYAFYLNRYGFLHPKAKGLLSPLLKLPFVLGAKGSGAMGAEVLCMWFDKKDKKKLFSELKNRAYTQIYSRAFEDFPQGNHFSLWKPEKEALA